MYGALERVQFKVEICSFGSHCALRRPSGLRKSRFLLIPLSLFIIPNACKSPLHAMDQLDKSSLAAPAPAAPKPAPKKQSEDKSHISKLGMMGYTSREANPYLWHQIRGGGRQLELEAPTFMEETKK
eukprot:TRINITY_DN790_c0_g2_i1.p2 TRINITY_DN790_c0_g2~~TRINITY_DN790_c0_g2_i1.p2  ORF type:complete len:127 (+),score=13.79 TRINITY_DN790_c0_g2_i1:1675-2055(+)